MMNRRGMKEETHEATSVAVELVAKDECEWLTHRTCDVSDVQWRVWINETRSQALCRRCQHKESQAWPRACSNSPLTQSLQSVPLHWYRLD